VNELPGGTVTFLFTDIEGSTRLQRELGERWPDVHSRHLRLLRDAVERADGREVDRQGDALFAVFSRARSALTAAADAQRSLLAEVWPGGVEVRVRMGIHTGEPTVGDEGYLGLDVVRAARICSLARGGQVLVSETTRSLVRGGADEPQLQELGRHRLKDFEEPELVFGLVAPGLDAGPPPVAQPEDTKAAALVTRERSLELATRAVAATRDLEGLGETITRQVDEMLARAGFPQRARAEEAPQPSRRRWWQRKR
jgi:class 3 adenylate cyclase